jgi:cytoskeletal protein CcmA (bactofilin family)
LLRRAEDVDAEVAVEGDGVGEVDGDVEADVEADGEVDGEVEVEVDGEVDGDVEVDGDGDGDGEVDGEVAPCVVSTNDPGATCATDTAPSCGSRQSKPSVWSRSARNC